MTPLRKNRSVTQHSVLSTHHYLGVWRLARKELREILRDRRTIVTLIAMPLLLYPLMSVLFLQFSLANRDVTTPSPIYRVGIMTGVEADVFQARLERGKKALRLPAKPTEKPAAKDKAKLPEFRLLRDPNHPEPRMTRTRRKH